MSNYLFGIHRGKLTATQQKIRRVIARKHGCVWVYDTFPGDGIKSWFSGPNLGAPFDGALSRAVAADIALASEETD